LEAEDVTLEVLQTLNEEDFKEMDFTLGIRKKLIKCIQELTTKSKTLTSSDNVHSITHPLKSLSTSKDTTTLKDIQVVTLIGQGEFGCVYKGEQTKLVMFTQILQVFGEEPQQLQ
jgi:hypothetical protein